MFNAQVSHVNGNDAFNDLLSVEGNFFPIFTEVYQFCILQVTVNLGPHFSFTLLLLNTCLGLDSTSGHSHFLEFLTCVGPWIVSVQLMWISSSLFSW